MEEPTKTTAPGETGTTSQEAPVTGDEVVTSSESTDGRAAAVAPEGEEEVKVDLDSVPKELRPHVEKCAKKFEKDFKGAYTRKFQELGAKEKQWEQERSHYAAEKDQWTQVAREVLTSPDPMKKIEALREVYGLAPAKTDSLEAIPDNIKTVGDLLAWNKQQLAEQETRIRQQLLRESQQVVVDTLHTQKWDAAIKEASKDKHFAKYADLILEMAKKNPETQAKYRAGALTAAEVLKANHEKLRTMLREDMEEVKAQTLAEQRKKAAGTTSSPTKTFPVVQKGAQSREEVIARVRARFGPPEVTV